MADNNLSIPVSEGALLKAVLFVARWLRPFGFGKGLLRGIRGHVIKGTVSMLHQDFAHRLRDFGVLAHRDGIGNLDNTVLVQLPECCCKILGQVLEIDPVQIHCTIKLVGPSKSAQKEETSVYTITRSAPRNGAVQTARNAGQKAGQNSPYAALLGCSDGNQTWHETYRMFSCPDLTKYSNYSCSRVDWKRDYRASIVLPLRYTNPKTGAHEFFGFMTFDSMNTEAFASLPDIFEFPPDKRKDYLQAVGAAPITHVLGLMADSLSSILYFLAKPTDDLQPEPESSHLLT